MMYVQHDGDKREETAMPYYVTTETGNITEGFKVRLIAKSNSIKAADIHAKNLHDNGVFPMLVVWGSDNNDAKNTAEGVFGRTINPKSARKPRATA